MVKGRDSGIDHFPKRDRLAASPMLGPHQSLGHVFQRDESPKS